MADTPSYPGTQAVTRAISLLKSFSDSQPVWQLNDLAQANGLNRSTAYRLLATLEGEGLVTRHPESRLYCLGPELIALGGCALRSSDLRTVARPVLESLAASTGETATLEVMAGRHVIVIDETSGHHLVGISQDVGMRLPAHATSTGKALLAYAGDERISGFLELPPTRLTEHTLVSTDAIHAELQQIRSRGYAVATDELEIGFVAIAAPVFDYERHAVAAISVGGPSVRLTPPQVEAIAEQVVGAAKQVSSQLGYRQR